MHTEQSGNVSKTNRYFGVGGKSIYRWLLAYRKNGENGLNNAKPISINTSGQTLPEIVEKAFHLRKKYCLRPIRIVWYLTRYQAIRISDSAVYRILKRNGVNRLPRETRMRKVHTKRYQKQVPGHHIKMDVKFLAFINKTGKKIKPLQYIA